MPVSGNGPARLQSLIKQVLEVANEKAMRVEVSKNLGAEARKQVMDEFREQRDPYGERWPATYRGGQILALTARLRNSIRPISTAEGFSLATNVAYARIHNYGGIIRARVSEYLVFKIGNRWSSKKEVKMPKRQFLPDEQRGLGTIWTSGFERVLNAWMRSKLGRKAA